jgi:hypothetical protein
MNPLERSLIEKTGYANGWENVRESTPGRVVMFSARHKAEAIVSPADGSGAWQVHFPSGPAAAELDRSFSHLQIDGGAYQTTGEAELGRLLRRAAVLAMALPNHAAEQYATEVAKLEAEPPTATETLRLTKKRRIASLKIDTPDEQKIWDDVQAQQKRISPGMWRVRNFTPPGDRMWLGFSQARRLRRMLSTCSSMVREGQGLGST